MQMLVWCLGCSLMCSGVAYSATVDPADLVEAALARTKLDVRYDGRYFSIPYPNGDVPKNVGVCTDVVIRVFRTQGVDLQRLVHEDMKAHFSKYPQRWGLKRTDRNIDHRRVPNLETYFTRRGVSLPLSKSAKDYQPGDLVTWDVDPGRRDLPHIGIVVPNPSGSGTPWIVHNIGAGPQLEDVLFAWKMKGHFRFLPSSQ